MTAATVFSADVLSTDVSAAVKMSLVLVPLMLFISLSVCLSVGVAVYNADEANISHRLSRCSLSRR